MSEQAAAATSTADEPAFALSAPEPVASVKEKTQAAADAGKPILVKLEDATKQTLDGEVGKFFDQVLSAEAHGEDIQKLSDKVSNMGGDEIRKSTAMTNRMMDRPMRALKNGPYDQSGEIFTGLTDLRKKVEELDPAKRGDLFSTNNLAKIPLIGRFFGGVQGYFREFESGNKQIQKITESLLSGQDELLRDNADLEEEKRNLWTLMGKMEQFSYIAKKLDDRLVEALPDITAGDAYKGKVVEQEILFYVRQKRQDLITHMAVCMQGYLSFDLIIKNNKELSKGVDRATTTTLSALRTAAIICHALTGQRLVLDQINQVDRVTSGLIEGNAKLMGEVSADIHRQATEAGISPETLHKSFEAIFQSLDAIDTFKSQALGNMQKTITVLEGEVNRAKTYMDKTREAVIKDVRADIDKPDSKTVKL